MTSIVNTADAILTGALTAWVVEDDTWEAVLDEAADSLTGRASEKGLLKLKKVIHAKSTFDKALERANKVVRFGYSKPANFDQFPEPVKESFRDLEEYIQECNNSPPNIGRRKRVAQGTKLDELVVALINATNKSVPHVLTEANVLSEQTNSQLCEINDTLLKILEQKGIPDDLSLRGNTEGELKSVEAELVPLFERIVEDQHQLPIDLKSHSIAALEIAKKQLEAQDTQNAHLENLLVLLQSQLVSSRKQHGEQSISDETIPNKEMENFPKSLTQKFSEIEDRKDLEDLWDDYHQGTRKWILSLFADWIIDEKKNVFALVGHAGIGKSTVAAQVVKQQNVLAYHFFDHTWHDSTATSCIWSLSKQLCSVLPGYAEELSKSLKSITRDSLQKLSLENCVDRLLKLPLKKLKATKSEMSLLVVDAVDECEESGLFNHKVIKKWKQIAPKWLKLFVTCRPDVINFYDSDAEAASHGVTMLKTSDPSGCCEGNVEKNMEDIRMTLKDWLTDRVPKEEINERIDQIANKTHGLFLYLRFFKEQLGESEEQECPIADDLPEGIGEYYQRYFQKIYDVLKGDSGDMYQSMIGAVLWSRGPLPKSLWMRAAGVTGKLDDDQRVDERFKRFVNGSKLCQSLMHIPNELHHHGNHPGVSFIHKSMSDFLSKGRNTDGSALMLGYCDHLHVQPDQVKLTKLLQDFLLEPNSESQDCVAYGARNIFYHRCRADQMEEAMSMLFDLKSLLIWLNHSSPGEVLNAIVREFLCKYRNDPEILADVKVVQKILQLGQRALSNRYESLPNGKHDIASELPSQIIGRLSVDGVKKRERLRKLYEEARMYDPGVQWLRPSSASLISALPSSLLNILHGHSDSVSSVAFNATGTQIVSGSRDNTIRIWDVATGEQIGEPLSGHLFLVTSVAFNSSGTQIVSGSWDNTVRIWDVATAEQIGEPLTGHLGEVTSVSFNSTGTQVVSSSYDKTVRMWDVTTGEQIGEPLTGHSNWVTSVVFNSSATQIVSGSYDNTVRIWNVATGEQIGEPLTGHSLGIRSVAFNPTGTQIISGSKDNTVRIWDVATGEQIGEPLTGHSWGVNSVAFNSTGTQIVSGSADNTVRIWDIATREQIGEPLSGHSWGVESVAFNSTGTLIVSGSPDNTIRIWDVATAGQVGELCTGHSSYVSSVAFNSTGTQIVSGSRDATVRIWDVSTGEQVGEPLTGHLGKVTSVAFSSTGTQIVSGSADKTVRVWNVTTGEQIGEPLTGHFWKVTSVAFNLTGIQVVSGSADNTVRIWDVTTAEQIGEPLTGHSGEVTCVAFNATGTYIVSGSYDYTVRIWDVTTGEQIGEPLTGHSYFVTSVAFNSSGTQIVSGSWDETVRTWDVATGELVDESGAVDSQHPSINTFPLRSSSGTVVLGTPKTIGFTIDQRTPNPGSCALRIGSSWAACIIEHNNLHFLKLVLSPDFIKSKSLLPETMEELL